MIQATQLEQAREALRKNSAALDTLAASLDDNLVHAVQMLANCKGKVVVSGVGKSAIVARKIAATFCCGTTPAVFLHGADAAHGDVGILQTGDVVVIISHSGETKEALWLLQACKQLDCRVIAITAQNNSRLAQQASVALCTYVEEETCHLGVIPTTSALVAIALGDVLCVSLAQAKSVSKQQVAFIHQGGLIGAHLAAKNSG